MLKDEEKQNLRKVLADVQTGSPGNWNEIGGIMAEAMAADPTQLPEAARALGSGLTTPLGQGAQKSLVRGAIEGSSGPPVGTPGPWARDVVWLIGMSAIALVVVVTAVTLSIGLFVKSPTGAVFVTKSELLLSVLTLTVGFLSGVFVPSPGSKDNHSIG